ncbi:hypothetical protein HY418_03690 [Candidatus Kaiserbacteria bacterium]|nr:hypothetical protein [Candidatus Kaiserbacteria bacterium]
MKQHTGWLVIAGFGVFAVLALAWIAENRTVRVGFDIVLSADVSSAEIEHAARERIRAVGAAAAYEEFAAAVETLAPAEQHTYAHVFGATLFDEEDLKGVVVCDARFSYGCYHEFLGRAIAAHGLEVVPELNDGCTRALVSSPLSCQHGIGHGIAAYLGYGEDDLRKALETCRGLPHNDPIGGCYGGVFMEYNLRTMLGEEAQVREVKSETYGAYEPCRSLPSEYVTACVFWQPQWWQQALFGAETHERVFHEMGTYCREMNRASADLTRTCFEGIGNITAMAAEFDAHRAARLCDATSERPLDRLFCRSYAANSLTVGGSGMRGDGEAVCEGLSVESLAYCTAYARNEANIMQGIGPPSL